MHANLKNNNHQVFQSLANGSSLRDIFIEQSAFLTELSLEFENHFNEQK